MDQLSFQCLKEAFCHGIVPSVSFTTHALQYRLFTELLSKLPVGVLPAPVVVEQQGFGYGPVSQAEKLVCLTVAVPRQSWGYPTGNRSAGKSFITAANNCCFLLALNLIGY
jgi:hypothetical protein